MYILNLIAFIFGLLWGSFANVLIFRLPRSQSVIKPRSHCTKCERTIPWFHNIPLLSYFILKGKCFSCGATFSWRYPMIELICGLFSLYLFPKVINGTSLIYFLAYFFIFVILLAHFFIDLEFQILPDSLNIGLFFFATVILYFKGNYQEALIGGFLGFLFPLTVTFVFYKLRGQIGLGGGDIKLFAILGILFGPLGVLQNIFMSCFLGALIGLSLISMKKLDKNKPFAFGPMIIIVTIIQLYFPKMFSKMVFLP